MADTKPRVLIYVLRRDVRLSDNSIFHAAASRFSRKDSNSNGKASHNADVRHREDSLVSQGDVPEFTHLLPVYVFPASQVEISGFLSAGTDRCPYPEARSRVAGVWRTGPHRAKFMAEGVWDLKERLEGLGCNSGMEIRVGMIGEVVQHMLDWYAGESDGNGSRADVAGIWMTSEEGTEEKKDEREVRRAAEKKGVNFKVWEDEKYYIDDRDVPVDDISDLPNVYTTYRKSLEPLRDRPRHTTSTPTQLPPLPSKVPPQKHPFEIPNNLDGLTKALLSPLEKDITFGLPSPLRRQTDAQSAHPFSGGETAAQDRLSHLLTSGAMSSYKATRNGMLGLDFSTKLSAFLAQGHLTARQVHWAMVDFEEGKGDGKGAEGYGKGENDGTAAVRFELLWRDYMRLVARKFGSKMFDLYGTKDSLRPSKRNDKYNHAHEDQHHSSQKRWKMVDKSGGAGDDPEKTREFFTRFRSGRTGIGLVDASNRELFLTGYTSNRARQNVASFLASHLGIDWRIGAEWYEFLLIDYDMASNWGNWQYVAGVGNDPRQGRVFNPVKQALDYDSQGEYVKAWVPELRDVNLAKNTGNNKDQVDQQKLMGLYQAWRLSDGEKEHLGLKGLEWVEDPLVRIPFSVGRGRGHGGGGGGGSGRGRGWRGKDRDRGRGFRRQGIEEKAGRAQSANDEATG